MALTATITTNTTTGVSKKALCGTYSFHGKTSTLDSGRRDQIIAKWTLTSVPTGFQFRSLDPRITTLAGSAASSWIDPQTTGIFGWSFAFPMEVAGDYTVRLDLYDTTDGSTSYATTTVTVAAAPSGAIYLDSGATGAADGTSWDDAYTNADTAMSALLSSGGDTILWVKEGTSYIPTSSVALDGIDNIAIRCNDPDNPFTIDQKTSGWYSIGDVKNMSVVGISDINTTTDDTSRSVQIDQDSPPLDVYFGKMVCGATGNRMYSFMSETFASECRTLLHDILCENPVLGASSLYVNAGQHDVVGGFAGVCTEERPVRCYQTGATALTVTINGLNAEANIQKSAVRFQVGEYFTVDRCKLKATGAYSGNVLEIEGREIQQNGDVRGVRISRCLILHQQTGNGQAVVFRNLESTNQTDNTASLVNNIVVCTGIGTYATALSAGTGAYAADIIGNTVLYDSTGGYGINANPSTECRVIGNIVQYTGAVAAAYLTNIQQGSGNPTVEDNVFDPGDASNSNNYKIGGARYTLTNYNALTGVSGNTEDTITFDSDYDPGTIATYDISYGLDYYGNEIGTGANAGAVDDVPVPPTISDLSPEDDGTATDSNSLVIHFSENIAYNDGSALIEIKQGGSTVASARVDSGILNAGDRTEWTLTGILSGLSGAVSVRISSDAFASQSTGVPFAGISDDTTWNFTIGGSGSPTQGIRNAQRTRGIRTRVF